MSKKLIAVASAAALALTALVGVAPASASYAFAVTPTGQIGSNNGATEAAPLSINVPSQDVLRWNESTAGSAATTASLIRLQIQASTTSATVRVAATGGAKVVTEAQYSDTASRKTASGATSVDATSNSANGIAFVYVYTTSTTTATVTVTQGGNSRTLYIKGATGSTYIYNLNFTAPTTANVSGMLKFTGNITDVFGNQITGLSAPFGGAGEATFFGAATGLSAGADDDWEESTTTPGTYTFNVNTSATAGSGAVGLSKTVTRVTGFAAPKSSQFFSFTTASLADQVTALQAQVAALTAQLNASVTKAKYNKLARKWNRANPSNKVKLQR